MSNNIAENEMKLQKCIIYISKHLGNIDNEPKPTLLHCIRTGLKLFEEGYPMETCLGGLLHDMIEDTPVTIQEIEQKRGKKVAEYVMANTKNKNLPKHDRNQDIIKRCIHEGKQACIILATEMFDGLQYYERSNNTKQYEKKKAKIQLFLKQCPFNDPLFQQIKKRMN